MPDVKQKHSAGGVIIRGKQVLTIKWRSKDVIEFPKGTVEPHEASEQTAVREVLEETGYDVRIVRPIDSIHYEFDRDMHHYKKRVDFFLMELVDDDEPIPKREAGEDFDNLWLNIDEADRLLTHDDSKNILKKVSSSSIQSPQTR